MCGFVGITQPLDCPPEAFGRMVDALAHRGPDGRGTFRDERVALGHRRLSILDPTGRGAQPMWNADKTAVIVYNGEIYNHRELRRLLPHYSWKSGCDTETLLALYDKEGDGFLHRLNGMFAFAIYDLPRQRLFLARDRLGIKPLFLCRDGKRFLFASEIRAFRPHPQFSRGLDEAAVRDYFLFGYVPAPRTIFRGVRKVEPGCKVVIDLDTNGARERRWWNARDYLRPPDAAETRPAKGLLRQRAEELEALILDSVQLRTLSDVPLGCFLSGGIDSSTVAWGLTRAAGIAPRTFTMGFDQPRYDESPHAARVASKLRTEHTAQTVTGRTCLEFLQRIGSHLDEPFGDASMIPTMLLSRMTRQHVTVALSGDGGDELFLGYDRYRWALEIARRMSKVPNGLRRAGASLLARVPHYKLSMMARTLGYRGTRELYPFVFIGWNNIWADRLTGIERDLNEHPLNGLLEGTEGIGLLKRASYLDIRHYLVDDLLVKVDRASMAYGLEVRVPLLDHRIVEFALRQPAWMGLSGGVQKRLLKAVLYRHLPRELFERPKAGFAVPLHKWLRGPLSRFADEILAPGELRRHGWIDPKTVQLLLQRHRSGRWNHERQLWSVLAFQLWHRANFG